MLSYISNTALAEVSLLIQLFTPHLGSLSLNEVCAVHVSLWLDPSYSEGL